MGNFSFLVLLLSGILTGCATQSPLLTDTEKSSFFEVSKDPKMATLFLACGKHYVNGKTPTVTSEDRSSCGYTINGLSYSRIDKGQIGKIVIPGGNLAIDNIDGKDPIKNIQVAEGTSALLISDWNEQYNETAMAFGLIGFIYDRMTTDRSKLNGPLQIYTGDFMQRVSGLIPVKVQVVK